MNPRPESGRFRSRDQPIDNRTGALKTYELSHNIYQSEISKIGNFQFKFGNYQHATVRANSAFITGKRSVGVSANDKCARGRRLPPPNRVAVTFPEFFELFARNLHHQNNLNLHFV
jgi:hypothetical protein